MGRLVTVYIGPFTALLQRAMKARPEIMQPPSPCKLKRRRNSQGGDKGPSHHNPLAAHSSSRSARTHTHTASYTLLYFLIFSHLLSPPLAPAGACFSSSKHQICDRDGLHLKLVCAGARPPPPMSGARGDCHAAEWSDPGCGAWDCTIAVELEDWDCHGSKGTT